MLQAERAEIFWTCWEIHRHTCKFLGAFWGHVAPMDPPHHHTRSTRPSRQQYQLHGRGIPDMRSTYVLLTLASSGLSQLWVHCAATWQDDGTGHLCAYYSRFYCRCCNVPVLYSVVPCYTVFAICLLCVSYAGKSGWAATADCLHPSDTCNSILWRERAAWQTDRLWAQQQYPSVYVWNTIHRVR